MDFEILPVESGDAEIYDIITITSPERWTPHKLLTDSNDPFPYDPSDLELHAEISNYPASLNHLSKISEDSRENKIGSGEITEFFTLNYQLPIMDTQICATFTWHRVIYQNIDPRHLRPYLSYIPLAIVKKTLEKTTQMARLIIRHP